MRWHTVPATSVLALLAIMPAAALAAPGDLDPTFGGGDGWVLTTNLGSEDYAADIAVDSAGRIVLVGNRETSGGNSEPAVLRYTAAGDLDPAFGGGDGIVPFRFGTGTRDSASAVAIDGSNRIVVAGNYGEPPCPSFCNTGVVRLTESGQFDASFAGDGKASASYALVGDVAIDGAGRIVVGGEFATFRFTETGLPDPTFSGDGTTTEGAGAWGMALDGAGRIVTVSEFAAVSRLLPDGQLDPSFGDEGEPVGIDVEPGSTDFADAMAVDASDRILAAGNSAPAGGGANHLFVARLTEVGALDSTLAGDGIVVGESGSWASSLVIDEAGRLLVVAFLPSAGGSALLRYLPDGSVDSSFGGGDGTVAIPFVSGRDVTTDIAGRIVVGGSAFRPDEADLDFAAARYLGDTSPSPSLSPSPQPSASVGSLSPIVHSEAPRTKLGKAIIKGRSQVATFTFSAPGEADATFQCKLDRGPFKPCRSPKTCRKLKPGPHVFRVRAKDALGQLDQSPASKRFRIPKS